MKFILIVLFFNFTACAEPSKYYCYSYPNKMVWHDKIILIEGEKNNRSVKDIYLKKDLYKSYDEDSKNYLCLL